MKGQGTINGWKVDRASPFFILNFSLDIVNGIRGFDLKGDGFARKPVQAVRTKARACSWKEKLTF